MPNHGYGGRPSKKLENYRDDILNQIYELHWRRHEVIDWLADNKNLVITRRTLHRYLTQWGAPSQDRTEDTEQLRQRIHVLFCRIEASDEEMLKWLQAEGFIITSRGLVRIRKELGFKRLKTNSENRDHQDEDFRELNDPDGPKWSHTNSPQSVQPPRPFNLMLNDLN